MNLDLQLAQLESAQLVRRLAEEELAYAFKHALTQETAYESLLKKARRNIHWQVAQAIETQYADRLDEFAVLLARHYAETDDSAKTFHYSIRAGDAASRIYANAEAIAHFTRALEIARRSNDGEQLRSLYLRLGREMELSSQFAAALTHYTEMEKLARERGDRTLELSALIAQCQIRCTATIEFNPAQGEPLANQALQLARELNDRAAESKILWILVNLYRFTDRTAQAREAGERSLAFARELNLREQMAYTLNDLSHAYSFDGDFGRARHVIQEATQLWRELENLPMLADSLSTACMDDTVVGRFDEAIALSDEAYQISQTTGNLWGQTYSLGSVGLVYWMRGETAHAIQVMEEALRLSEQSGYPIPQLMTRADLGLALASMGAFDQGLDHARRSLEFAETHYASLASYSIGALVQIYAWMDDYVQALALCARLHNEKTPPNTFVLANEALSNLRLASAQGDHELALDASLQLLQRVAKFGLRTYLPEALYRKGLAERALGQTPAALATLLEARQEADARQARWMLWQILDALGDVQVARGNLAEAEKLFGQAREVIAFIADHAPGELRESFLKLPQVQEVKNKYVDK